MTLLYQSLECPASQQTMKPMEDVNESPNMTGLVLETEFLAMTSHTLL